MVVDATLDLLEKQMSLANGFQGFKPYLYPDSDNCDRVCKALEEKFHIRYEKLPDYEPGYTLPFPKVIVISDKANGLLKLSIMIHEVCHLLNHRYPTPYAEVEAESVSYLVLSKLGFQPIYSAQYIKKHGGIICNKEQIHKMANEILNIIWGKDAN